MTTTAVTVEEEEEGDGNLTHSNQPTHKIF